MLKEHGPRLMILSDLIAHPVLRDFGKSWSLATRLSRSLQRLRWHVRRRCSCCCITITITIAIIIIIIIIIIIRRDLDEDEVFEWPRLSTRGCDAKAVLHNQVCEKKWGDTSQPSRTRDRLAHGHADVESIPISTSSMAVSSRDCGKKSGLGE